MDNNPKWSSRTPGYKLAIPVAIVLVMMVLGLLGLIAIGTSFSAVSQDRKAEQLWSIDDATEIRDEFVALITAIEDIHGTEAKYPNSIDTLPGITSTEDGIRYKDWKVYYENLSDERYRLYIPMTDGDPFYPAMIYDSATQQWEFDT